MLAPTIGQKDEGDGVSLEELQGLGSVGDGVGAAHEDTVYAARVVWSDHALFRITRV